MVKFKEGDFVSVRGKVMNSEPDGDGDVRIAFRSSGYEYDVINWEYVNADDVLAVLPPAFAIGDKVRVIDVPAVGAGEVIGVHQNVVWVWFPGRDYRDFYAPADLEAVS